jgi:hypothetical protein
MRLFPTPPVGFPVIWFPQANCHRKELGKAGFVTMSGSEGRVSITVFPKGGSMRSQRDCRHVLDPIHKRRTESTIKNGGWDFVPGLDYKLYRPEIVDLEEHLRLVIGDGANPAEGKLMERILTMFSEGHTTAQIAVALHEPKDSVAHIVKTILDLKDEEQESNLITKEQAEQMVQKAVKEAVEKALINVNPVYGAAKPEPTKKPARAAAPKKKPVEETVLN